MRIVMYLKSTERQGTDRLDYKILKRDFNVIVTGTCLNVAITKLSSLPAS